MNESNRATHWRAISDNPVDPGVIAHQAQLTRKLCAPFRGHPDAFLKVFVGGKTVLDIGCAEHDASHWDRPEWQHAKLRSWSSDILGLDILPAAVEALNKRGFKAVCADATSDIDLGRRFDRVVVGDVLEHVNNPVDLIRFAVRHLAPDGLAVMRTPNPFWWRHFSYAAQRGTMLENAEHVRWVSPCCALELAHRAQAKLVSYHPQMGRFSHFSPAYWATRILAGRPPEIFASSYLFIFSAETSKP